MAEPSSTSAAALGLSSGMVGAILLSLGISWPLLLWGVVGCVVGLSWAPAVGRIRAGALFFAAAMLSAKGGALMAAHMFSGSHETAQGLAAAMGIVFHPALTATVNALPAIIAKRFA